MTKTIYDKAYATIGDPKATREDMEEILHEILNEIANLEDLGNKICDILELDTIRGLLI